MPLAHDAAHPAIGPIDRVPRRRFVTLGLTLAAALACAAAAVPGHAAPDPQQVLRASDKVRNPGRSFRLQVDLQSYRYGKPSEASTLMLYSRADPTRGDFRSLLQFISPARDAGKLSLKSGRDLWMYDPHSQASIPLSPQQRLLGQAANGDVMTANWALDYDVVSLAEDTIQDGDRQRRDTYRLHLSARRPDVTYHAIDLWVDRDGYRSRKARFYTESGELLKTAYYRRYLPALGRDRPTETVIIDGLNPQWVTVMRYSKYTFYDVPEAWLQRDYLPQFHPK